MKTQLWIVAAALGVVSLASIGQAGSPVLVAVGSVSGFFEDFAAQTAPPLENGVPGNRLGGMGSGLAYLGGDYFLGLPDRGPNAKPYNDCTNDTASYIPRFHTLHMTLAPSDPAGSTLPLTVTPMVVDTTLLWSQQDLVYGAGCGAASNGEPALNTRLKHYFSGRSDNFAPGPSTNPASARLDPEGIRVSNDWQDVFVTDEYGPYVYQFDRQTGRRTRVYTLPSKFAVANQSSTEALEFSPNNTAGRVANKGMEGLAITPDGRTLVGAMQSPLIQDGGDAAGLRTRIVTIDLRNGATHEYAYQLDQGGKKTTVSEILAVNNHQFLVDERDSKGLGDDSKAAFKKIFLIDLAGATDVSHITGQTNLAAVTPVSKVLFLDVAASLIAGGIADSDIPAKLEGIAFGQDVTLGSELKHTLYVVSDNDFLGTATRTTSGVPAPVANPNRIFVFAFSQSDLPGYQPQQFLFQRGDTDGGDGGSGGRGQDH
ncbi:MAG: esterase-like activity of phytase family protein [Acidobacteriota bacterium]